MAATMPVTMIANEKIETENVTKIEKTNIEKTDEILGKNEMYDYAGGTIVSTTSKVIGCWTKLMIPMGGGFNCRIQPLLRAKTIEDKKFEDKKFEDQTMATLSLDFEGFHTMSYTPWKLVNKTSDSKLWIMDEALIEERNKNEEQWKLKNNQLDSIESASDASFEHAEGE
jgi:hypothetical protein